MADSEVERLNDELRMLADRVGDAPVSAADQRRIRSIGERLQLLGEAIGPGNGFGLLNSAWCYALRIRPEDANRVRSEGFAARGAMAIDAAWDGIGKSESDEGWVSAARPDGSTER